MIDRAEPTTDTLALDALELSPETQPRANLDRNAIDDYAEAMERGDEFPPVQALYDGETYWLYDGFHRVQAARVAERDEIAVEVEEGTKEEAIWLSLAANKRHGLRRSQADKRRAIKRALKGWGQEKSDRAIAEHIGCHHNTVAKYRRDVEATGEIIQSDTRTGRDGRTIDTSNIGGQKDGDDGPAKRDESARNIRRIASRIRNNDRRTGEILIEMKELLSDSQFEEWRKKEMGWSQQTVEWYMDLADQADPSDCPPPIGAM